MLRGLAAQVPGERGGVAQGVHSYVVSKAFCSAIGRPEASADKNAEDTALPTPDSTLTIKDRRKRLRFPLDTDLRYQIAGQGPGGAASGTGQVLNISSFKSGGGGYGIVILPSLDLVIHKMAVSDQQYNPALTGSPRNYQYDGLCDS